MLTRFLEGRLEFRYVEVVYRAASRRLFLDLSLMLEYGEPLLFHLVFEVPWRVSYLSYALPNQVILR